MAQVSKNARGTWSSAPRCHAPANSLLPPKEGRSKRLTAPRQRLSTLDSSHAGVSTICFNVFPRVLCGHLVTFPPGEKTPHHTLLSPDAQRWNNVNPSHTTHNVPPALPANPPAAFSLQLSRDDELSKHRRHDGRREERPCSSGTPSHRRDGVLVPCASPVVSFHNQHGTGNHRSPSQAQPGGGRPSVPIPSNVHYYVASGADDETISNEGY